MFTIAKEFMLLPVADNDNGPSTSILVLGLHRCSPIVAPVALNCVQSRHKSIADKITGQSIIVAIM